MGYGYFDMKREKLAYLFKDKRVDIIGGLPEDAKLSHIRTMNNGTFRMTFESKEWDTEDPKKLDPPVYERVK